LTFELYPAIDLREGRCVRLEQGDFERQTVYDADPVAVARGFVDAGARWLHVVDLDAARTGVAHDLATVGAIAEAVRPVAVQAGGGVRSLSAAAALVAVGVQRVVVGTVAVENPALFEEMAAAHRVAVGIDTRRRGGITEVAVRGWGEGSGRDLLEVLASVAGSAVEAVIVTDIARDGLLGGPDLEGLAAVLEATSLPVIASGGVASVADIKALADLSGGKSHRTLSGVIVGKALYERRFGLREAVAACAMSG